MPIVRTTRFTVQLLLTDEQTGHRMTISGSPAKFLEMLIWLTAPLWPDFNPIKVSHLGNIKIEQIVGAALEALTKNKSTSIADELTEPAATAAQIGENKNVPDLPENPAL